MSNVYLKSQIPEHLHEYFEPAEIGLESTPDEFIARLVEVFREVRRVLRSDGTVWVNMGDSYAGGNGIGRNDAGRDFTGGGGNKIGSGNPGKQGAHHRNTDCKPKDLLGIPWMLAFALRADGWWLRQDIIWSKPNPMPESVRGSHYSRHTVTIDEYERLSGLQYTDERPGDDWAGDMPSLSEKEVFSRKAPLSAKHQGTGNSQCKGAEGGCPRKTAGVQPVGAGFSEQGAIRQDGEGYQDAQGNHGAAQGDSEGENDSGTSPSTHENKSRAHSAEIACGVQLHQESEGQGSFEANVCAAQGCDSFDGQPTDSRGLGIDCGSQSGLVPLLRDASETDAGSCDATEQGWTARKRECSASLPAVQLQKEQQDTATTLVGCPGCPKCIQHHGYIFHLSAGRCTKAHEYIFLLSKSASYYYDNEALREPLSDATLQDGRSQRGQRGTKNEYAAIDGNCGFNEDGKRNKRSVWTVATHPFKEAHFATFPPALIEPCILAGCPPDGTVLDPFFGAGTTGLVADRLQRDCIGIELNPAYAAMARKRIDCEMPLFNSKDSGKRLRSIEETKQQSLSVPVDMSLFTEAA